MNHGESLLMSLWFPINNNTQPCKMCKKNLPAYKAVAHAESSYSLLLTPFFPFFILIFDISMLFSPPNGLTDN